VIDLTCRFGIVSGERARNSVSVARRVWVERQEPRLGSAREEGAAPAQGAPVYVP